MATATLPDRQATEPATTGAAGGGQRHVGAPRFERLLAWFWHNRLLATLATVLAAASYGVLAGWWTPRGPDTTVEALLSMALAAGIGLGAGAAMRSRWAMILAPLTFVAMFELSRLDATGPTVDGLTTATLTSMYGLMALGVGRLFHGILVLWPMLAGVACGRAWALRRQPPSPAVVGWLRRSGRRAGRLLLAVSSAALVVLAVALLRPATTEPVRDASGEVLTGSVAELATVEIGGNDQSLLIRGYDRDDPVVLFLAGGPGGSETGTMSERAGPLERDFVVVTWDQLGTGRSTGQFDPAATLGFERAVADTIEVTEHLRDRFGVDRVYLVGNSYGTLVGARAAQQRPDLYAAFVGVGQMVDVVETDQLFYDDAVAHAEASGDRALATTLRDNGPPPYDDLLLMGPLVASEHTWNDYSGSDEFPGLQEPTDHLFVTEYSLMDTVRSLAGMLDTYETVYPELYDLDLRDDVTSLDVPVFLVEGAHEARGRIEPAEEWFDILDAPHKEWIVFERSGHRPWAQEPERFAEVMTGTVLATAEPDASASGSPAGSSPAGGSPATTASETASHEANQLRELFAGYNPDVWPLHLVAYAFGLALVALVLRRPGPTTDRIVSGGLAAIWAWLALVFLGRYAATIDPLLSAAYGALFLLQAALLLQAGLIRRELRLRPSNDLSSRIGWAALGYALLVYPLLGVVLGHPYPEAPLFGMAPCPTTIATFGLLLLAGATLAKRLLVVPTIWAVLAPLAAVGHGYGEDLGLVVVALAAWLAVLTARRASARSEGDMPCHPTSA